jgi:glucose-6-phosphate 1-dehydrogenase
MIEKLVLFGATGDLAGRFLLPALAALHAAGKLPERFGVTGSAITKLSNEEFQRVATERLEEHAADVPAAARASLVQKLRYRPVDFTDRRSVAAVISDGDGSDSAAAPLAAYLALPTGLFPAAVIALCDAGLPQGSRIVLEKPFGENLESAVALNALLARLMGSAMEESVFRVDHVLGMATVQNLIGLRLANPILESIWNSAHIEQIEILWEETLALEGRAKYYDKAGALKDVMQNHMLQLLSLTAMEPPSSLTERDLRDAKVAALRSVRALTEDAVVSRTRRARYTAGRIGDRAIPSYVDEKGVDPERGTETFAEVMLDLDTPRWIGTRFVLRAGKAMRERRKEIIVRFRSRAEAFFAAGAQALPNALEIGVDGPLNMTLRLTGSSGSPPAWAPLTFRAETPASDLPAYSRVLMDIFSGGVTLSVRGDEAEESWRVLTPVLNAWADGRVPLQDYRAGSAGPPAF